MKFLDSIHLQDFYKTHSVGWFTANQWGPRVDIQELERTPFFKVADASRDGTYDSKYWWFHQGLAAP